MRAGVIAAGAIVFQTVRGPGPAGTDAAGTMATGVLDKAQLEGPVSGTVALYRDGGGLGLRFDLTASGERDGNADRQAQADLDQSGSQHQAKHVAAIGAERHSNADFIGAPRHAVGCESIQSKACEDQRQCAE